MSPSAARPPILPTEGLHVLHLYFRVEYGQWETLTTPQQFRAKTSLAEAVQEIRALPDTQLLVFSVVSPKADLGFLLVTPDLQTIDAASKRLELSLGPDVLSPTFSWLSLTERDEYADGGIVDDRLDPVLPDWPVICFYPMNRRRAPGQNWYALDFETRKGLMAGQSDAGLEKAGSVQRLITGSTGLDDGEWGVTLFAQTTSDIKDSVYRARFGSVDAGYTEFGEFFTGIQMPLDALFDRLNL